MCLAGAVCFGTVPLFPLSAVAELEAHPREGWWGQCLAARELGNAALLLMIRGHMINNWLVVCLCLLVSFRGCNCILY